MTHLSPHFTRTEIERSEAALRHGLINCIPEELLDVWRQACLELLEPMRALAKKPLFVRSGYRRAEVNRLVGGSANSQHCGWWIPQRAKKPRPCAAFDLQMSGGAKPNLRLFEVVRQHLNDLPLDQLIWEFGAEEPAWVHVSYVPSPQKPRRSVLRAVREEGRTVYRVLTRHT